MCFLKTNKNAEDVFKVISNNKNAAIEFKFFVWNSSRNLSSLK